MNLRRSSEKYGDNSEIAKNGSEKFGDSSENVGKDDSDVGMGVGKDTSDVGIETENVGKPKDGFRGNFKSD